MTESEKVITTIRFEGDDLRDNWMNLSSLGSSLFNLSETLAHTNKLFNGDKVGLDINGSADVEQNSIELLIGLSQSAKEFEGSLLLPTATYLVSIREMAALLGITDAPLKYLASCAIKNVLDLFKQLKTHKLTDVQIHPEHQGSVTNLTFTGKIENSNFVILTAPTKVVHIAGTSEITTPYRRVFKPLDDEECSSLEFRKGKTVYNVIRKNDLPQKEDFTSMSSILSNIRTTLFPATVAIYMPAYLGDSKWKILYDKKVVSVTIEDKEWLGKFQTREVGAPPGYLLRVELEEVVRIDSDKKPIGEAVYIIKKVYSEVPPPKQHQFEVQDEI